MRSFAFDLLQISGRPLGATLTNQHSGLNNLSKTVSIDLMPLHRHAVRLFRFIAELSTVT